MSSRKLQAWTTLGDDWDARDTRLCFKAEGGCDEDEGAGKGALKEKVDVAGGTGGLRRVDCIGYVW